MNTTRTLIATAAALLLAGPALAQPDTQTTEPGAAGTQAQRAGTEQNQQAMQRDPQTVRQIQQKLEDEGYRVGAIDGIWGPKTSSALKEFQQAQGLDADGKLSQSTLSALGIEGQGGDSMAADQMSSGTGDATGGVDGMGAADGEQTTRGAGDGQGAAATGESGAGAAGEAR